MRLLAASLVGAATLSWSAACLANAAAIQIHPAVMASPTFGEATRLEVTGETLTFDCRPAGGVLSCRFEAAYEVHNPTQEVERAVGAFYGNQDRDVTIEVDGKGAGEQLTPEDLGRLDRALDAAAGEQIRTGRGSFAPGDAKARFGFTLAAGPGERHRLVARGVMDPGETWYPRNYRYAAVEGRHLLLGREARAREWQLEYLIAPVWTWKGEPRIAVEVRLADPYRLPGKMEGWQVERTSEGAVARRTFAGGEAPATLGLAFERPAPLLENGGILLGIGGAFGSEGGLRARLGYELGTQGFLLASAVVETDFTRRVQLVPAFEAASPAILFIPSAGVGLGLPVMLEPEVRVGGRIQASAMFYPLGAFVAVDLYPRSGTSPGFVEVSLMLQGGL